MAMLADDTFHYSESNTPSPSSDPTYTNLVISYTLDGVADNSGYASGSFDVTSMSWDHGGTHYDCSGSPEDWTASIG
jgi:hypothetical protein